jgi:DNA-binding SARP family transcriptional activator
MLVYLAVRGKARREELIELLWGGVTESKARNAFRQALHRLRTALGEDFIPQERDNVSLGRPDQITVDRTSFLQLIEAGNSAESVDLYGGDFLEGLAIDEASFELWADGERSRLRVQFQSALQRSAQLCLEGGRWRDALRFAQTFVRSAPFDEDAAVLEATVLVAGGKPAEALASLQGYAARIGEQMGLAMPAAVRELAARIERTIEKGRTPGGGTSPVRGPAQPTTFVGREAELARLMSFADDLRHERGLTVVIEGEAGLGKTRLIEEFLARAKALGSLMIVRGRERAGGSIPYVGIAEALRQALRAPGLSGTSQHLLAEAARVLPELRDSFNLPDPGPMDDGPGVLRFFEGIAAFIESAAYEQPLCIVLDDAHNASPSSIDLLHYLSGRLQRSPVLLLLLLRSNAAPSAFAARFGFSGTGTPRGTIDSPAQFVAGIALDALSADDGIALARSIAGTGSGFDESDLRDIAAGADGNPARIIELTRRAMIGDMPASDLVSVRDLLWGRLLACSPSQRRLFFAAALLQRSASVRLLAAASHLPEAAALDAATAIENAGLLVQEGFGYAVAHDQTTAFVLDASGAAGRALLAGWAADALVADDSRTDAELAQLYATAGRSREAFVHARSAALQALAVGARLETNRLLGLALTFAPDAAARADIERMIAALGAGQRLLPGVTNTDAGAGDVQPEPSQEPPPPELPDASAPIEDIAAGSTSTQAADNATQTRAGWRERLQVRPWIAFLAVAVIGTSVGVRSFQATRARGGRVLADSVIVSRRGATDRSVAQYVSGRIDRGFSGPQGDTRRLAGPRWIDQLSTPWVNPLPSPDGSKVALERVGRSGSELFIISADRRDTIVVPAGGDSRNLGWSPDGRWLLVAKARTLPDGGFDSDLIAYSAIAGVAPMPIDTSADRAVTEAVWSPTGERVAWVARTGSERQQDVFVGRPDGSLARNLTNDAHEDYHIAWSPDGTLIGFTSERSGVANLFAIDVTSNHLWRLTADAAHDDRVLFSPDGRYAAFESTRGGDVGVYVMPALGGTPTRVTPAGSSFQLADWRGKRPAYVALVRVVGPSAIAVHDSVGWSVLAMDNRGQPVSGVDARLVVQNDESTSPIRPSNGVGDSSASLHARAYRDGLITLVASVPGWRSDTFTVRVGAATYSLLDDAFSTRVEPSRWISLGEPAPQVASHGGVTALFPNADLEWESGVLSKAALQLREGLSVEVAMQAPFGGRPMASGRLHFGLAAVADSSALNRAAPQFNEFASIIWNAESNRVTYSVDPESWSDAGSSLGGASRHMFRISIEPGGRVAFYADGVVRWRSTLALPVGDNAPRIRVWLGGRATGEWGSFSSVQASIGGGR